MGLGKLVGPWVEWGLVELGELPGLWGEVGGIGD